MLPSSAPPLKCSKSLKLRRKTLRRPVMSSHQVPQPSGDANPIAFPCYSVQNPYKPRHPWIPAGSRTDGRSGIAFYWDEVDCGRASRSVVPCFRLLSLSRVLSEGLEGLAAGNRANKGKDTHASLRACFSRASGCKHPTGRRIDRPDDRNRRATRRQGREDGKLGSTFPHL